MTNNVLRRIACLAAMLGLGMASLPGAQAVPAALAPASISQATAGTTPAAVSVTTPTGRGWGSIIGCAGCAIAAGLVVAGGPASILIAVNTPGSAIALLGCVGTCYEALAT
jgi:hypothetical protein